MEYCSLQIVIFKMRIYKWIFLVYESQFFSKNVLTKIVEISVIGFGVLLGLRVVVFLTSIVSFFINVYKT